MVRYVIASCLVIVVALISLVVASQARDAEHDECELVRFGTNRVPQPRYWGVRHLSRLIPFRITHDGCPSLTSPHGIYEALFLCKYREDPKLLSVKLDEDDDDAALVHPPSVVCDEVDSIFMTSESPCSMQVLLSRDEDGSVQAVGVRRDTSLLIHSPSDSLRISTEIMFGHGSQCQHLSRITVEDLPAPLDQSLLVSVSVEPIGEFNHDIL